MKYLCSFIVCVCLMACSGPSGQKEKELATEEFINCNFYSAMETAQQAIDYAGDDINIKVTALLILGKSADILDQPNLAHSAYEKIVSLAPGVSDIPQAKEIANNFVSCLSEFTPEKVKNCPALQG